jgi:hypothetical protein
MALMASPSSWTRKLRHMRPGEAVERYSRSVAPSPGSRWRACGRHTRYRAALTRAANGLPLRGCYPARNFRSRSCVNCKPTDIENLSSPGSPFVPYCTDQRSFPSSLRALSVLHGRPRTVDTDHERKGLLLWSSPSTACRRPILSNHDVIQ